MLPKEYRERQEREDYRDLCVWYIIWALCVAGSSAELAYSIAWYVSSNNQYSEVQCISVYCIVTNCATDNCFNIYTIVMYNNINISFNRAVATSWNCSAEYPTYPCWYGNNQLFRYYPAGDPMAIILMIFMLSILTMCIITGITLGYAVCSFLIRRA
jgi:hypothetical protein